MKKLSFLFAVILLATTCLAPSASAASLATPDFAINAKGVYLYNFDDDTIVFEMNADDKLAPASLTKIMTCILALEMTEDLDREMVEYPSAVQDWLYDFQYVQGNGAVSTGGLRVGEKLPMRQMLYAMMLPSANEAAMSVAEHLGGSQEGFAELMNKRAKELGATNTNFENPNGLPLPNHYTTARDIAKITMHALTLPFFEELTATVSHSYEGYTWETTNAMMVEGGESSPYYPGLKGVKTGSLPDSGRCLVSTATKNGLTYLLVVMGSPWYDDNGNAYAENLAFKDTKAIYDWVFESFRRETVIADGRYMTDVKVKLSSERDFLKVCAAERLSALKPANETVPEEYEYDLPEEVRAPVERGEKVGSVTVKVGGNVVGTVDLIAMEDIKSSTFLVILDKIRSVMKSFWFKFIVVFIILLFAAYVALMVLRNRNRRRSGYRPRRRL